MGFPEKIDILNFGSLNIDHVYQVDHFARAGETLATRGYEVFAGGKGFNQSIALARAGARVGHAGRVGSDGAWLVAQLAAAGVDVSRLETGSEPTGHAVIQVEPSGENSILIHGGANRCIDHAQIDAALDGLEPGCLVLVQNELNALEQIIEVAASRGAQVVLNPSPITDDLLGQRLDGVRLFVLNRSEAEALTGETHPTEVLDQMRDRFPAAATLLTLGADGAHYADAAERAWAPAQSVTPIDTTGAGDTFCGFFVAERIRGGSVPAALDLACRAAALCVQRAGAAASIPERSEVRVD